MTHSAPEPVGAPQGDGEARTHAGWRADASSARQRSARGRLEAAASLYAMVRGLYCKAYNDGGCPDGHGYSGGGHWDNVARWAASARGIRAAAAALGHELGRTLDLGCGRGVLTDLLDAVGLDIADVRSRRTAQGNALALPFVDDAFRTVVALDIVEHVPWDWQVHLWAELRRVCTRALFVTVPTEQPHYQLRSDVGTRNHYLCGTPEDWRRLFRSQGFDVVREGRALELYGAPFAHGPGNYPFFIVRRGTWSS